MADDIHEVKLDSNKDEIERLLDDKAPIILEKIGLVAERYAKQLCPVDTGRLRNSITHAIGGGSFSIKTYHASYGSNRDAKGKRIGAGRKGAGAVAFGSYSGSPGTKGDNTVYIGTNVEYAPVVELGGKGRKPKPYLKPAVVDHVSEYKRIIADELSNS